MFAEEKFLTNKFGNAYLEWSENVPAFISKFKNSKLPFSWKKVLKMANIGLFVLFLIFCFFFYVEIIQDGSDYNYFLMVMYILTGFCYIVLKYLKKNTVLLNKKIR
jgi:protein-S-isoprenylcysteine O-methyltransferase Ste14